MKDKFWIKPEPKSRNYPKKYPSLQMPWNLRYSRMKAQAKYRKQEFALSPEEYMQLWEDSGVKEHCGKEPHQYCMVRLDNLEAWSVKNCIIVSRRMYFRKGAYENWDYAPRTDWQQHHGVNKRND